MEQTTNRRSFLRTAVCAPAGLGFAAGMLKTTDGMGAQEKSTVVVVRNPKAISERNVCDQKQAAVMIQKALLAVTGKGTAKEAWAALGVAKDDVVGIKVNCNAASYPLFAHPELVMALTDSLAAVVPSGNIVIYDRSASELSRAGFTVNPKGPGVLCMGTEQGGGFHPQEALTRIVTDRCTKLINLPSLKTFEGFAGSLFLKNHIGTLPRSEMLRCHGNAVFCSEVCARPSIKSKTVLALCDGLRGTFGSGDPWYWGGIIASRDQVAAEYTALQVINEKRKAENMSPYEIPSYVKAAETTYRLGTCTPGNITTVRLEG
jgi:uncharacterized protein (DUF362 family)